ncbi:SulP family inorganic anion transporter [Paenibacillus sp. HB172176]|uniref:SulP family inorganic anion transporter n=1 Tax=Paenibacillus sp. HB172176 TaxID=2493690 RepID=UPI00143BCC02|nr:SulP family inorganic anion transporter [Paenibacillus sp. HB172176]
MVILLQNLKKVWFFNVRADILAGITVALALIPEAIGFSIIADVDPMVGLYASFCIAVIISIVGGRPAMISAATGAMAVVMVSLVANHGLEYLFAATVLTGIIQIIIGILKLGRFITFVPHSVVIGFVNALAIVIFSTQLVQFENVTWVMYALVAAALLIIYILPLFTKAVPSALVAIIVITCVTVFGHIDVNTVGDMGSITSKLPVFHIPDGMFSWETLKIIFPTSVTLAFVGLLESLMTATILDEATKTKSDKNKEIRGQGIANLITGFFGGMAGCAMIGQSGINVKSGGRGRLSTLTAGVVLLILIMVLSDVVVRIPMAALVGVMIMVSIGTFDWRSLLELRKVPLVDSIVMLSVVGIVVYTHNLALGVLVGVIISALSFGWRMAKLHAESTITEAGVKHYGIRGQLFFGTMSHFADIFRPEEDPEHIVIDFSASHVWDQSAVTAIAKVMLRYEEHGKTVSIVGLNAESKKLVERIGLSVSGGH